MIVTQITETLTRVIFNPDQPHIYARIELYVCDYHVV